MGFHMVQIENLTNHRKAKKRVGNFLETTKKLKENVTELKKGNINCARSVKNIEKNSKIEREKLEEKVKKLEQKLVKKNSVMVKQTQTDHAFASHMSTATINISSTSSHMNNISPTSSHMSKNYSNNKTVTITNQAALSSNILESDLNSNTDPSPIHHTATTLSSSMAIESLPARPINSASSSSPGSPLPSPTTSSWLPPSSLLTPDSANSSSSLPHSSLSQPPSATPVQPLPTFLTWSSPWTRRTTSTSTFGPALSEREYSWTSS